MAVTVTSQLTTIDACEATTDWSVHNRSGAMGTLAAIDDTDEEVPPVQGTYCLCWDCDVENGGYIHALASTTDMSSKMIYVWIFCLNPLGLDDKLAGGIYIIARDTSNNHGYWYVGGKDNYQGGWKCVIADLSRSPDANDGTAPTLANCNAVGVGFKNTVKSKATHNMFIDFMREADLGDGIKVTTTATSVADWDDLVLADYTNAIGVIREYQGVYFIQGPITFGDTTSGDMEFYDTSKVIVFEDADVQAGHYEITVQGNSSGTIEFELGDKSGGRGVSGCSFGVEDASTTEPPDFTMTDTDIDVLGLYGCSFINMGTISLPVTGGTTREVLSCTFEACERMDVSTCKVQYCFFVSADTEAIEMDSTSQDVDDCTFISSGTGNAIYISTAGSYTFTNHTYSGYSAVDENVNAVVENSTAGSVTITVDGGDSPSYYNSGGGSVTVLGSVPIEVNGLTEGSRVAIIGDGGAEDGNIITEGYANATGKVTDTFTGTTPQNVIIRARNNGIPNAVFQNDSGVGYTDYTNEARDQVGTYDVEFLPSTPAVGDEVVIGGNEQFFEVLFNITSAGSGYSGTWEYFNGISWTAVSDLDDGTSGLQNSGWRKLKFDISVAWDKTSLNGSSQLYFLKYRVTGVTTPTQPRGEYVTLNETKKYKDYDATGTIAATTGLTVTAIWVEDTINP